MNPEFDVDAELQAWYEAQGVPLKEEAHRCPNTMPPCPVCQELDDEES